MLVKGAAADFDPVLSLAASYDSSSSIPTPDMSVDVHSSWNSEARPVEPPRAHPLPQPKPAYSSGEDPFASPSSKKVRTKYW